MFKKNNFYSQVSGIIKKNKQKRNKHRWIWKIINYEFLNKNNWKFKDIIDGINSRPDTVKGQFCRKAVLMNNPKTEHKEKNKMKNKYETVAKRHGG